MRRKVEKLNGWSLGRGREIVWATVRLLNFCTYKTTFFDIFYSFLLKGEIITRMRRKTEIVANDFRFGSQEFFFFSRESK